MNTKTDSIDFFDVPEEPQLSMLIGYSDCKSCFFRESTLKRIQENVKQLQGVA
jgi:hypothetical protein